MSDDASRYGWAELRSLVGDDRAAAIVKSCRAFAQCSAWRTLDLIEEATRAARYGWDGTDAQEAFRYVTALDLGLLPKPPPPEWPEVRGSHRYWWWAGQQRLKRDTAATIPR